MPTPHKHVAARGRGGLRSDHGATAVEYSVMLFAIVALIVAIVVLMGRQTESAFDCTYRAINPDIAECPDA